MYMNTRLILWTGGVLVITATLLVIFFSNAGRYFIGRFYYNSAVHDVEVTRQCLSALPKAERAAMLHTAYLEPGFEAAENCFSKNNAEQSGIFEFTVLANNAQANVGIRSVALYNAAILAYGLGDCKKVRELAEQGLALAPNNSAHLRSLAAGYFCERQWVAARDAYEKAYKANPNNVAALNGLAASILHVWFDPRTRPGDHARTDIEYARVLYERAIEVKPTDWRPYYSLGSLYHQIRGDDHTRSLQLAVQNMEMFFKTYEESGGIPSAKPLDDKWLFVNGYYVLGDAYATLGDKAKATTNFQQMLDMADKDPTLLTMQDAEPYLLYSPEKMRRKVEKARAFIAGGTF